MGWSFVYLGLCRLLQLVALLCKSERSKELEILLLREGCQNHVHSGCGSVVLVQEAAEAVAALANHRGAALSTSWTTGGSCEFVSSFRQKATGGHSAAPPLGRSAPGTADSLKSCYR